MFKKKFAKTMSAILAASMLLGSVGNVSTVQAEEPTYRAGMVSQDVSYYYAISSGWLLIGGDGVTSGLEQKDLPWYSYLDDIKQVHFRDTVTQVYGNWFENAKNLQDLVISPNYKRLGSNCFRNSGLTAVYAEGGSAVRGTFNIPGTVEYIGYNTFDRCQGLKKLIINEGTKTIDSSFYDCTNLKEVTLPQSLTSLSASSFTGCSSLETLFIPKNTKITGGWLFEKCPSLREIKVDPANPYLKSENGFLIDKEDMQLVYYPMGKRDANVCIPEGVKKTAPLFGSSFRENKYVNKLIFPETMTEISSSVLYDMPSVSTVYVPKSVTPFSSIYKSSSGYNVFLAGNGITTIYYGGTESEFNTLVKNEKITSASGKDIKIVYNHKHNYNRVFLDATCTKAGDKTMMCECGAEKKEAVPALGHDYATVIESRKATTSRTGLKVSICSRCQDVKKEVIPKLTSGAGQSTDQSVDTEVVPEVTVKNPKVGDTFVSEGNTYKITKVSVGGKSGEVSFEKTAAGKKAVAVVNGVSVNGSYYKVTEIAANACKKKSNLKKLAIGKNVKKIGSKAFYGCKKLKSIVIKSTKLKKKTVGKKAFSKIYKKVKIKVPKKKFKSYKKLLKARGITKKTQKIVK